MSRARPLAAWTVVSLLTFACSASSGGGWGVSTDGGKPPHPDATAGDAHDARARVDGTSPVDARSTKDAGEASTAPPDSGPDAAPPPTDAAIPCDSSVTWTSLFTAIFGPSGTSSCTGTSCHTNVQAGFLCGTTAVVCYHGMVAAELVTPGAGAPSSVLVDPEVSPLCGVSPGGDMPELPPPIEACVTDAQVASIQAWLGCGAPMN